MNKPHQRISIAKETALVTKPYSYDSVDNFVVHCFNRLEYDKYCDKFLA